MVVQTRSGPKFVDPEKPEKVSLCHHGRHYPLKDSGGLRCSECARFYCTPHLEKKYDVNTFNGPPSLWVCFFCRGCCACDVCQNPTPPRRNPKPKKKTRESQAERQLKKELELKEADVLQLRKTIEEGLEERKQLKATIEESLKERKQLEVKDAYVLQLRKTIAEGSEERKKLKTTMEEWLNERKQLTKELELKEACVLQLRTTVEDVVEERKQLKETIENGINERKQLTLRILELQGNCRVFCRVRPVFPSDGDATIEFLRDKTLLGESVTFQHNGKLITREFDKVFLPDSKQENIFSEMTELVQSAIDGHKVSIFSYGQTGSGKTFTMIGKEGDERGLIPRAVELMFQQREKLKEAGWDYNFKISMIEIYADYAYDILTEARMRTPSHQRKPLMITESGCPELVSEFIESEKEFHLVLNMAREKRISSHTRMNEESSRSHLIVTLSLSGQNGAKKVEGTLNLIDLAGSERTSKTGVTDVRQQGEAKDINLSLGVLKRVFLCILEKKFLPPYRGSTLTKLLKFCLGFDESKVLMIVNLSRAASSSSDTLSSLDFANCVHRCVPGKKPCPLTPGRTPKRTHQQMSPSPMVSHAPKKRLMETQVKPPMVSHAPKKLP